MPFSLREAADGYGAEPAEEETTTRQLRMDRHNWRITKRRIHLPRIWHQLRMSQNGLQVGRDRLDAVSRGRLG